jgi:hypothetical protein
MPPMDNYISWKNTIEKAGLMGPLLLLGRALEFHNGDLFLQWRKRKKMMKKSMHIPSRGEWNGLLECC